MTSFTTAMLTRTTEDPCIGTSAPYINFHNNLITLTPGECEFSNILVRTTPASTMIPREFLYSEPFEITEDTYISAYNLRAGYKLGADASGKLFEYDNIFETPFYVNRLDTQSETQTTVTVSVHVSASATMTPPTIEYSTDLVNWTAATTSGNVYPGRNWKATVTDSSDKIYLRANITTWYNSGVIWYTLNCQQDYKIGGNLASMLYGSSFTNQTSLRGNSSDSAAFKFFFSGSTTLVDASDLILPTTSLHESCYGYLFNECTGLVSAPSILSANTLSSKCYERMFSGCTSLVNAPVLPARVLGTSCYSNMFTGCTSLVNAPVLPATILASGCYSGMFQSCTSLVTAPALPATDLESYCYQYMFYGCTALTTPPALPAKFLSNYCYYYMFYGCTSLTTAPELPARTLMLGCYQDMFTNCSSLNYIKAMFISSPYSNFTANWVNGVAAKGTFVKNNDATWTNTGTDSVPVGWTVVGCADPDDDTYDDTEFSTVPFFIENKTSSAGTVTITKVNNSSEAPSVHLYTSTDNITWNDSGSTSTTLTLPANGRLYIRTTTNGWGYSYNNNNRITANVSHSVGGNLLSLIYGSNFLSHTDYSDLVTSNSYTFAQMFLNDTALVDAYNLIFPKSALPYCYYCMFQGCTGLTTAPRILPSKFLSTSCYGSMFQNCSSLTTVPIITASSYDVVSACYRSMFEGCSSLTSVPSDYLPLTSVANSCYKAMFKNCTSLVNPPDLSNVYLANNSNYTYCYEEMFYGCRSLNNMKSMLSSMPSGSYTSNWLYGVSATGTFTKHPNMSWTTGVNGVPSGWTVVNAS